MKHISQSQQWQAFGNFRKGLMSYVRLLQKEGIMNSPIVIDLESDEPQSDLVYCIAWDSGSPGAGADAERVYRLDNKYYYWSSSGEDFGPFDTLQETLLDNELLQVTPAVVGVDCSELSAEGIAKMLVPDELSYGHEFSINDEIWVFCEPGLFRKK